MMRLAVVLLAAVAVGAAAYSHYGGGSSRPRAIRVPFALR
jgi:hypothetical protein